MSILFLLPREDKTLMSGHRSLILMVMLVSNYNVVTPGKIICALIIVHFSLNNTVHHRHTLMKLKAK